MFESEAYVADWERTGRVPVPPELLAPPDLTDVLAAGPPVVDEFADGGHLPPDGSVPDLDRARQTGECDADGDGPGVHAPGWAGLAPGVALAATLTAVGVSGLSEFDLVEAVAGWERLAG